MSKFTADEQVFKHFTAENYPESNSFLKNSGKREEFNRKNSQIIVNKLPVDILFIGDSITEGWETSTYFNDYGRIINRGIGGEKLSELALRFKQDCIDLKPRLCILASGINDTYPLYKKMDSGEDVTEQDKTVFLTELKDGYLRIVKSAKENGIRIWLASVLPLGTSDFRSELIIQMNNVIKKICQDENLIYVDYHSKMTKDDGKTMCDYTFGDMLHPHVMGYNVMYNVLDEILKKEF